MPDKPGLTKRGFLQTVAAGAPTLRLLLAQGPAAAEYDKQKFTPIDCSKFFNASGEVLGPRPQARGLAKESEQDSLIRTPGGLQSLRGIPFLLGPGLADEKSWIALSANQKPWLAKRAEIPVGAKARFLCIASFCEWDPDEDPPPGKDVTERIGQVLAEAVLLYEGGGRHGQPLRRRFETGSLTVDWGHLCYAATPHRKDIPSKLHDPLSDAMDWGQLQMGVWEGDYPGPRPGLDWFGTLWISAIENPNPERLIRAVTLEARSEDPLFVCGLTLYQGEHHPLRCERLQLYRITLPDGKANWEADVDLGTVARTYRPPRFEAAAWLASPKKGLSEDARTDETSRHLYVEVTASPDATLTLRNKSTGDRFEFDLGKATPDRELEARRPGAGIRLLEAHKRWLRGQVIDASTGKPTPVRLAFRSKEGRYIPPYGHRTEINAGWFQDYGADILWGGSPFAYVDGAFQAELPVGDVFVELAKGFEYEPVRQRLAIRPGQKELRLEIRRASDLRSKGWINADVHVHFLSPSTAVLEGQAEGLNLINLLAAQWGDLFTNVGDLSHGPLRSSDGEMIVQIGTENRQHILGHLALLGGQGEPVFPLSASGPHESYIGDPLWNSLAEWADRCREREGLVVAVHFPYPNAELAADIVLGKIDALEMYPVGMTEHFNNQRFLDWYRYLNCGYRLPAVAGTDKMGAWGPAGAQRVYAHIGQEEFSFANWAKAVRSGNTFMTSGPLLLLEADGKPPGAEIRLGAGGGSVEVRAEMTSAWPVHRLEIVLNGKVVASREDGGGARQMTLREKVSVPGPAWIAARCASRMDTGWSRIAAHTSPVYVTVPGRELFSAPAAAYMLRLIDGSETWVRNLATRPDQERFDKVVRMLAEARKVLEGRVRAHGG